MELDSIASGYSGSEILHDVTIQVREGQIVSILGPNGAGKTTLLKTIMGVVKSNRGQITFAGKDITRFSPNNVLRSGIAYVPQGRSIFPWMSVHDNIEMGAYIIRDRGLISERINNVYKLFPRLFERKSADAGVLSGGERQMLSIGRALMLDPKLIMLDEPSLGLDPRFLSAVLQKIVELNSLGKTIVLVEQNVKKALDISAFAYILEGGSVKLSGTPTEINSHEMIRDVYLGGIVKKTS